MRQAADLRESEMRLKVAMAASRAGVFQTSGSGLYLSPRWLEILGLDEPLESEEDFQAWMSLRIHSEDRAAWVASRAALEAGDTERHEIEMRVRHAEGHWVWLREYAQASERDESGGALGLTGVIVDISKPKQAERDVMHLALHDSLTGLSNRHRMISYLDREIEVARRTTRMMGIVHIDLDGFKKVNSAMGHGAGDELLRAVAFRLAQEVRGIGLAARIGGDEFAMVFRDTDCKQECRERVAELYDRIVAPFQVDGNTVEITASFGIAVYPADGDNAEAMMRHADLALREFKHSQRQVRFFEKRMAERAHHRARMETALRRAIEREDFLLHYQPQVCLETGEIRTVEALVRWLDSDHGLIMPGEFISIAETSGAIRPLGAWILKSAARQQAAWKAAGVDVRVAINVSPAEAGSGEFMNALDDALSIPGVSPDGLEFEITEGLLMDPESGPVKAFLDACTDRGIRLAIDDFGKGYSSLSYLEKLPIDKIKIDHAFVAKMDMVKGGALVEAIVDMARRLGKSVVAEGVERRSQADRLRTLECKAGQGRYFAPPLAADALPDLVLRSLRNGGVFERSAK